jgi:NADPH:quinone reductase-like Zn-dependent oxidoreductase
MKALRIHTPGDTTAISYDEIPQPQPEAGEVLVKEVVKNLCNC